MRIVPIFFKIKRNEKIIPLNIYVCIKDNFPGVYGVPFENYRPDRPASVVLESIYYAFGKEVFGGSLTNQEYFNIVKMALAEDFYEIEILAKEIAKGLL